MSCSPGRPKWRGIPAFRPMKHRDRGAPCSRSETPGWRAGFGIPWMIAFQPFATSWKEEIAWQTCPLSQQQTLRLRLSKKCDVPIGTRKAGYAPGDCAQLCTSLAKEYNLTDATASFHRNGFLILEDALPDQLLHGLRNASSYIMDKIFEVDPEGSFGGGAGKLPHRYSLGDSSATKSNFHLEAYAALVDLPTTTPLLQGIFGSPDYLAAGCGGDVVLAGAIEYQSLHPDAIWGQLEAEVSEYDVPPAVTINFVLQNLTATNGAMRIVPGSHRWRERPPSLLEEPDWMRLNTLCPVKAGAAVFRDNRCWHGGTPNLAEGLRALPNVEYFPPGAMPSLGWLDRPTMPLEIWQQLSPLARHISRGLVVQPGEQIVGQGIYSPASILDIMPFLRG
ncbi:unnamed protein product [Effrenium voratum]|nr:unnamed protein product [Effrenium voratum]